MLSECIGCFSPDKIVVVDCASTKVTKREHVLCCGIHEHSKLSMSSVLKMLQPKCIVGLLPSIILLLLHGSRHTLKTRVIVSV